MNRPRRLAPILARGQPLSPPWRRATTAWLLGGGAYLTAVLLFAWKRQGTLTPVTGCSWSAGGGPCHCRDCVAGCVRVHHSRGQSPPARGGAGAGGAVDGDADHRVPS